jgi:hypothetical protein
MKPNSKTAAMFLLGFVSLLSGCAGSPGSNQTSSGSNQTSSGSNQTATLIVYQEDASVGTIQVLWNGQIEVTNLAYQKSTGPLKVQAGAGALEIRGSNVPLPGSLPLNLTPNTTNNFLIWGWGMLSGTTLLTADTTPAEGSGAKLRVESCETETPADLYVLPLGSTPNGNPTYKQLICNAPNSVGGATPTYQVLSPGTYDIFFTWPDSTDVLYETSVTLTANQNRTLVLLNDCASATYCNQSVFTTLLLDDLS